MIIFVIILVLALVTWYIIKAQSHLNHKKYPSLLQAPLVDKDVFFSGLQSNNVSHPLIMKLTKNLSQYIYDNSSLINTALIALLSKGHVLIQGQPGTGKTKFIQVLTSLCEVSYSRIQCTPDMLPQDVLGTELFDQQQKSFVLHTGPIVANIVHVDEINRATPKLQSAFLQAMQESQVSIGNTHIDLPHPFFLLATQNPYDNVGTYSLPYAQIDRFMLGAYTKSLDMKGEYSLLHTKELAYPLPCVSKIDIENMQEQIFTIHMDDATLQHCVACIDSIRAYSIPISTRATKALSDAAKSRAYMQGKVKVEKSDVDAILLPVCKHRIAHVLGQSVTDEEIYRIITGSAQKDDIVMQ